MNSFLVVTGALTSAARSTSAFIPILTYPFCCTELLLVHVLSDLIHTLILVFNYGNYIIQIRLPELFVGLYGLSTVRTSPLLSLRELLRFAVATAINVYSLLVRSTL